MAPVNTSPLLALALNDGFAPSSRPPFGRLLVLSLTLHAGFLFMAGKVHFSSLGERPLVAQEVSLVSLAGEPQAVRPASSQAVVRPSPVPKPAPRAVVPEPAPAPPAVTPVEPPPAITAVEPPAVSKSEPLAPSPVEAPVVSPVEAPNAIEEAKARSEALMQEALSKIKLPTPRAADATAPGPASTQPTLRAEVPKPTPTPAAPDVTRADPRSKQLMQDALGKIELPPAAPTFKPLTPAPVQRPTASAPVPKLRVPESPPLEVAKPRPASPRLEREINSVLDKLRVPDAPKPVTVPQPDVPVDSPARKPRPSLSDSLKRELDVLERLHQPKPVPRSTTAPSVTEDPATPPVVAKATPSTGPTQPATAIRATGSSSGSSEYLARVQLRISHHWVAPPVDLSGRPLSVVIAFRLHRSGTVSNVTVEDSSGNPYYDLAAKRAVLSADPLPSFPNSMSEHYLDTHFTFSVKEPLS